MRIAFWGTPEPAVPSLRAFVDAADIEVAVVVTNPDRPAGRGHKLQPPPVKAAAAEAGLSVWQPQRPREVLAELQGLEVDACAVVAYGALLPADVLAAGGRGFVNLHFSLLPAWRGAAPVQHTLLHGDAETGVTCFVLDEGMDTGPVLVRAATPVAEGETAGDLMARLADWGAPHLVEAVRGLAEGSLSPQPQPHDQATYAPKITPEDARLDFTQPADALERAVRAFNPVPGAHTSLGDLRLKVHRARGVPAHGESGVVGGADLQSPGMVVAAEADGPVVACGSGGLVLVEVQPAGKPRMAGAAFVNGYHPVGQRLGV